MKGAIKEGVESCRDLYLPLAKFLCGQSSIFNIPKNNASIFCSSPSMLPNFSSQLEICCSSKASIRSRCVGSGPGIDNKTGACLQRKWFHGGETSMESVQESLQRDLSRLIVPRTRSAHIGESGHGRRPILVVGHGCGAKAQRLKSRNWPSIQVFNEKTSPKCVCR